MKDPRTFARLVALAIMLLASTARADPPQPVSIALASVGFGSSPALLAREMGLFERHGLLPRIFVLETGSAATTAAISRSVDFASSGTGELIAAAARGQPVVVVATVYRGLSGTLVLARRAAARTQVAADASPAQRLKALEGLLVASTSPTSVYTVALKGAAKSAGVTLRFTYMAPPAMASALESGAIDGYIAGAPSWAPPVIKGSGVVWLSGPAGDFPPDNTPATTGNVQTMRDFAETHRPLVRQIIAVFADFATAAEREPAAVKAALARVYPALDAPAIDLLFAAEASAWKTAPPTVDELAHDIAFARSGYDTPSTLDAANPAAMLFH